MPANWVFAVALTDFLSAPGVLYAFAGVSFVLVYYLVIWSFVPLSALGRTIIKQSG